MVKNWKYYLQDGDIGDLSITRNQYMTGNIMGVLAEKREMSKLGKNVMNAKTFHYPVRYKILDCITERNRRHTEEQIVKAIAELQQEGCRFIVTTGGRFGLYDSFIRQNADLMVLSTPLAMTEYAVVGIPSTKRVVIASSIGMKETLKIIDELEIGSTVCERLLFCNLSLTDLKDINGKKTEISDTEIGALIWDSIEDYSSVCNDRKVPVFDLVVAANFIKDAVMRIPYQGGI